MACFSVILMSRMILTCGMCTLSCDNQVGPVVSPNSIDEHNIEMV